MKVTLSLKAEKATARLTSHRTSLLAEPGLLRPAAPGGSPRGHLAHRVRPSLSPPPVSPPLPEHRPGGIKQRAPGILETWRPTAPRAWLGSEGRSCSRVRWGGKGMSQQLSEERPTCPLLPATLGWLRGPSLHANASQWVARHWIPQPSAFLAQSKTGLLPEVSVG